MLAGSSRELLKYDLGHEAQGLHGHRTHRLASVINSSTKHFPKASEVEVLSDSGAQERLQRCY